MSYRLRREGDVLYLRPTLGYRISMLFLSDRRSEVDGSRRRVVVEDRVLGFVRTRREIPFDRVDSIEYNCEVRDTLIGRQRRGLSIRRQLIRQAEVYKVGVELRDPFEIVTLARFFYGGIGPRGGISLGSDPQAASREVVDHLEDILGISLSFEAPEVGSLEESRYRCTRCDRPSPPNRKSCQYCGAAVMIGP